MLLYAVLYFPILECNLIVPKKLFSIYKKEVLSYFNSLIGYLAIAFFLLIAGLVLWVFPDTSILDSGYASLEGFFNLAPYLFIFLIPAIMMRSIAGEKMDGTYDLLLSRPLSMVQIVLGKFFGGLTIVILAIVPTLLYSVSIYLLAYPVGNIDIGTIIGSYIGLIFLASCFVAISLFCSSLANNPIVAFLLAVFVNFFMFYGIGATSQIMALGDFEYYIKNLGIDEHYLAISRGVLMAKDCIYFCSVVILFLIFSIGHLTRSFSVRKRLITLYLLTLTVILLINQDFVTRYLDRIDFSEDKRFTLTGTSKDIVSSLDDDIYITIFLDGDLPSGFKRLREASINMANDLRSYAKGKIHVNLIDPSSGSVEEQGKFKTALIERGLFPTNLNVKSADGYSQKLIFPYAIINRGDKEINVNFLQNRTGQTPDQILNNSIQNLEYAFVSAITKASNNTSPFIAFTEGHGEASDLQLYDAMHSLAVANQVGRLNLDSIKLEDLKKIQVLIIAKPQEKFSESDKYKIDFYVRNGGSIIWAIDQIDASMDYIRESGAQTLIGRELNLDDQLFLYGARLKYEIIADLNCSQIPLSMGNVGGQAQIELAPWYFFPIIMPNSTHPIIRNLDGIRSEFVGTIDTIASEGIQKEVLLTSSPFARVLKTPSTISLQMVEEIPDPTKFKSQPYPIAVLLTGKFPYLYENRPTPENIFETVDLSLISKAAKMFVIADGDWLINQVNAKDQSPFPLGWDRYTEKQYANKILLENVIDYLMNDEQLIALRNREVKLRLLDKALVKQDRLMWQMVNVVCPIVILLLVGAGQQYLRKRKYKKSFVTN